MPRLVTRALIISEIWELKKGTDGHDYIKNTKLNRPICTFLKYMI